MSGARLTLAEEFFFILVNEGSGRIRMNRRAAGIGCAAAVLAESVLSDHLEIFDKHLRLVGTHPVHDELNHAVLSQIATQPQHGTVRVWLDFLQPTVVRLLARRLAQRREIQITQSRRLLSSEERYQPVDLNRSACVLLDLSRVLTSSGPIPAPCAFLGGLVQLTGLMKQVLWRPETRDVGVARLQASVKVLPTSLLHLLANTEAAIGDAVLAPR